MPHPLWKGALSFGLVEIPVALHAAVARDEEIQFTLLDRRDFSPVGYERVSKRTGKVVPWPEIVKGYEHAKGEYVALTEAELDAANPERSGTIDLVAFVPAAEIDSVYFDTPYHLVPTNPKSRAYGLFREALLRSGRVGIAKVVIRTRQRIAALTVRGPAVVLNVLRYAYELRDPGTLGIPAAGRPDPKELALAERLVESMAGPWKPERFVDEYRKDILALVARKVKAGRTHDVEGPTRPKARRPKADVIDLMPLLEQSIGRSKHVAAADRRRAAPRTARRRPA